MFETFARMGGIFITVGDLFACGKEQPPKPPPEVAVLISVLSCATTSGGEK
ncbi:hypothetical protein [Petrimonas sp.]|uniref:hypothetical protein n=1 Tax=Petrimonas sp. TaxID=2023866 RepID=UPI003F50E45F